MKKEKKAISKNLNLKQQAKLIIDKAKKLNLVKPLSAAYDDLPCEKESHKGKKETFCR